MFLNWSNSALSYRPVSCYRFFFQSSDIQFVPIRTFSARALRTIEKNNSADNSIFYFSNSKILIRIINIDTYPWRNLCDPFSRTCTWPLPGRVGWVSLVGSVDLWSSLAGWSTRWNTRRSGRTCLELPLPCVPQKILLRSRSWLKLPHLRQLSRSHRFLSAPSSVWAGTCSQGDLSCAAVSVSRLPPRTVSSRLRSVACGHVREDTQRVRLGIVG